MNDVKTTLSLLLAASAAAYGADYLAFSGGYTAHAGKGIYSYRFDSANGSLKAMGVAIETDNPSFLAIDAKRHLLFAVHESNGPSAVSSFAIDAKSGKLALINRVASGGSAACHLALDRTGRWLAVANYGTGSVIVLPVAADGRLDNAVAFDQHKGSGPNPMRQAGPHAHEVTFSPDNRFLLANDLGTDQIYVYRFDATRGTVTPNDPPSAKTAPGAGPRHLVFHPNGRILYDVNEMAATVTAFRYDAAKGTLEEFQDISTLPEGFSERSGAEIAVSSAGTFLYASNRGQDTIALFAIDPLRFTLTAADRTPTLGSKPRHFALDPTGAWLLVENQDSGNIAVFSVHPRTGQLIPSAHAPVRVPDPVCLVFVP
jgi:6-phosphogluconolactonase